MKNLALVIALVLATTLASVRVAAACGATGEEASAAVGVWPRLERDGARTILSLSYPVFGADQGPRVYLEHFEVVRDRNLRRLERVLAAREHPDLDVTVERVDGSRWRVTGWSIRR